MNQRTVFIAELENSTETNSTVHFKNIPEGQGKFLITTIFAWKALSLPYYDADVHCCGNYVIWKLSETQKVRSKCVPVIVASDASQKKTI